MEKVIRDGKVAVLYSPGWGAGWSTWASDVPETVFHPKIVALVEQDRRAEITDELVEVLFPGKYVYTGGAVDLEIEWIPEGTVFEIEEFDGNESIHIIGGRDYLTA